MKMMANEDGLLEKAEVKERPFVSETAVVAATKRIQPTHRSFCSRTK